MGLLVILIIIIFVLLGLYFLLSAKKRKAYNEGLKSDSIQFGVNKSLREVNDSLRIAANQLGASVERLENNDPLGGFDQSAAIEVVLSGAKGALSQQSWAVQVYVYDLGTSCKVELIALGDSTMSRLAYGSRDFNVNLPTSISKRDQIARMLS